MMETVTVLANHRVGDEIGPVYIDEVVNTDAVISYRDLRADGRRDWYTNARAADPRGNRAEFWYMRIVDPDHQDAPFEFAWRERYGLQWPYTRPHTPHPALYRLSERFSAFHDDWVDHVREREETIYQRRVEAEGGVSEDEDMSEYDESDTDMRD